MSRSAILVLALSLLLPACSAGRPPVLEGARPIGPSTLVLQPEIRLGSGTDPATARVVSEQLVSQIRGSLAASGIEITGVGGQPKLRSALLAGWSHARNQGFGRIRRGADLGVADVIGPAAQEGAKSVLLAVLTRPGLPTPDSPFVPRPPGEIVPQPEDRPDYVIPQVHHGSGAASGVALDLVVVDATTGRVVADRHVEHPAQSVDDVVSVLPVLVREAARGITP